MKNLSLRKARLSVLFSFLILVFLPTADGIGARAPRCRNPQQFSGTFTLTPQTEDCNSVIGTCMEGTVYGDLDGDVSWNGTGAFPLASGVTILTGDNTTTTVDGILHVKDTIMQYSNTGEFTEFDIIQPGAYGSLNIIGGYIKGSGVWKTPTYAEGSYNATVWFKECQ